ncbi:hypothetical protein HY029_05860 [Candidatus Gottesmanbacteria bacterium]|nr:hypothetical protein [Candidatus Gottesmanbacteria bacterium]
MFKKLHLVHNLRASIYLETLLTSSAITVVVIRYFLALGGYPQLGNGQTLHIAHMLWGGFIMIGVILFFLSFFGRHIHWISAVLGGIGFGIFIDELGKFITVNNDYFFQPAIPIMYFIFILFFFIGRHILCSREPTTTDYLINSMAMLQDGFINTKDREFYDHIVYLLKKAGRKNPYVKHLHQLVQVQLLSLPDKEVDHSFAKTLKNWYQKLLERKVVELIVIVFFILFTAFNSFNILQPLFDNSLFSFTDLSMLEQLEFISVIIIVFITLGGIIELIFSRLHAYKTLELSVYLSLFLLQIFVFYNNQLNGIFGVLVSITTLLILKYLIKFEEHRMRLHILGRIKARKLSHT